MKPIGRLILFYCRPKRPVLTIGISVLVILHIYFILSLLSYRPQATLPGQGFHHMSQHKYDLVNSVEDFKHGHLALNEHDKDMLGVLSDTNVQHKQGVYDVVNYTVYSENCQVLIPKTAKQVEKPFKIYIYELPRELNIGLIPCATKYKTDSCFRTDYCGYGPPIRDENGLLVHGTWQFSLETIIHHKLLFSPYRTMIPREADVFYVPYYGAMACFCYPGLKDTSNMTTSIQLFKDFLEKSPYYRAGKPHLMTVGKIEREHLVKSCPTLKDVNQSQFRIIGIEEEQGRGFRKHFYGMPTKHLILAPYPSYGHYDSQLSTDHNPYISKISQRDRTVYVFLASGHRRSNHIRSQIFDNLLSRPNAYRTYYPYAQFISKQSKINPAFKQRIEKQNGMLEAAWLVTSECRGKHHNFTLDWMQRSIFCLQPPGDSPTRKSFFDSIISGCIPVLFQPKIQVKYPFNKNLDYSQFTVSIGVDTIKRHNISIATILSRLSPSKIRQLQISVAKVSQYLQYDFPIIAHSDHNDAMSFILHQVNNFLKTKW